MGITDMDMNIAIFGGSFNPVHDGHIDIVNQAFSNITLDKLIVVPAFASPFKQAGEDNNAANRLESCRRAFSNSANNNKIEVSDFEVSNGGVSYTINTIKHFKAIYPKANFFLIVGEDVMGTIDKWFKIDEIRKLCKIISFPRRLDISSTKIRESKKIREV